MLMLTPSANADYAAARAHFDSLSAAQRVEITLGVIATGDYEGLLDFGFTQRYYKAVIAFESRERLVDDGILDAAELARLNEIANEFYRPLGIKYYTHAIAGSKLLVPRSLFDREKQADYGTDFERYDGNLALSQSYYPTRNISFGELFATATRKTKQRQIDYSRLRDNYFVVNGVFKGRIFYTWMSAIPSGSTGFTLSWRNSWHGTGKKLAILLANSFVALPSNDSPQPAAPPADASAPEPPQTEQIPAEAAPVSGTGTGFRVTEQGHVLTNYHVAGRCHSVAIHRNGELPIEAELVAADSTNDLALVQAKGPLTGQIATFASETPRAGQDIAVFGFPLTSVLASGGNIVTGNITSLAGLGNDSRSYQISAPVQPGNSGGPVMDRSGHVVAVVVAKLNAMVMQKTTGDVPQNVNFAIKANVAENFLDGANITYQRYSMAQALDTPAIAELAQTFTYLVECRN